MQTIETLLAPIIVVMALAFVFSVSLRYLRKPVLQILIMGVGFGLSCVLAMAQPIVIAEGIITDVRGLLVGLSVAFAGFVAGAITLAMAIAYRLYLGGSGAISGVVGLALAYGLAAVWVLWIKPHVRMTFWADVLFGLTVSMALVGLFVLPYAIAVEIFKDIVVPITAANTIGSIALGYIFRRELAYNVEFQSRESDALLDPLTNLLNRRGTDEKVTEVYGDGATCSALFYFDIDHFKQINDLHGHMAGDHVLREITHKLGSVLGDDAVFSRHGGDEFTVIVPELSRGQALALADQLRASVQDLEIFYDGRRIAATISVGVHWTAQPETFENMLRLADQQLFESKAQGRNTISASFAN